jgi:hypothetical protein
MDSESMKADRRVKDCRLLEILKYVHIPYTQRTYVVHIYGSAPESTANTFQDLPRLCKTADNTERYI